MSSIRKLVIASHGDTIYFVDFDEDARTISLRNSLRMAEQPSWIEASPQHADLIYVNSWVEGKIFVMRVHGDDATLLSTCESGGKGPTDMRVSADGRGLMVVMVGTVAIEAAALSLINIARQYAANRLSYLPLKPDGTFALEAPSDKHVHLFPFTAPNPPNARQDGAHPHHIILTADPREILVPTLGSDKIWLMRWQSSDEGWTALRSIDVAPGSGPRHGLVDKQRESEGFIAWLNLTTRLDLVDQTTFSSSCTSSHHTSVYTIWTPRSTANASRP